MSVADIPMIQYNGSDVNGCHEGGVESMSRWEPNARGRLEQAALDLYQERGFEQTTVTEIAERAGLTERTFFRYFVDKREVLFGGQTMLEEIYASAIANAPASAAPIDVVAAALEAVVPVFQERHKLVRQRQAVIAANPGLQERELLKGALLTSAMAEALRRRGVTDPAASLAAEVGVIVFKIAYAHWVSTPDEQDLSQLIRESLNQIRVMIAGQ
jgi:AcrR family transcriptional regulator